VEMPRDRHPRTDDIFMDVRQGTQLLTMKFRTRPLGRLGSLPSTSRKMRTVDLLCRQHWNSTTTKRRPEADLR
jgi:hypothetical protein